MNIWQEYFQGNHETVVLAGAKAAETMHVSGLSLVALKRYDEAETLLGAANHVAPNATWFANCIIAFIEARELDRAERFVEIADHHFPEHDAVQFMIGNLHMLRNRFKEAEHHLRIAIERNPNNWEAGLNHGNALRKLERFEEAIARYDQNLKVIQTIGSVDGYARTMINKGVSLCDLTEYTKALEVFDAVADLPGMCSPEIEFNRSTIDLILGNYERGWTRYLNRWKCEMVKPMLADHRAPMLTKLADAAGKHVAFTHEQGFGDSIQFIRFAPMLAAVAAKVTVVCPAPLVRLFETLGLTVVTSREGLVYDYECPSMNSPSLFGTTLQTIPDPAKFVVEKISIPTTKPKIGLLWAGQFRDHPEMAAIDLKRTIHGQLFDRFGEIDAHFVNLQFGDKSNECSLAAPFLTLTDDFLDSAAVMADLDLMVCVDTAGAHLAASLGVPTVLLSRFDGCWRWLLDRKDSPWYPSVTIVRKGRFETWEQVIERTIAVVRDKIKPD